MLMRDCDRDEWIGYLLTFLNQPNMSVADVACGTGEMTLRLHRAGHRLIGVDVSEDMLFVAQEKARQSGVSIPFVCQDMKALSLHKGVDAVVSVCDGVNYLLSMEDVLAFFKAAYQALSPGGMLLFDVSSEYKLQNVLACNTFAEDEGDCAYIWKNMYDAKSRFISMELTFFAQKDGLFERFTETHIQRAHRESELSSLLESAGFSDIMAFDAFTRNPVADQSERLQFVAVRES